MQAVLFLPRLSLGRARVVWDTTIPIPACGTPDERG